MGWEESSRAGAHSLQRGDYGTAERHFVDAVSEAKKPGTEERRVAIALNNLAMS